MTPEERKAAARRELARRELARRESAADVSRETMVPTAAAMAAPIPEPMRGPTPSQDFARLGAYLSDRAVQGLQNFAGLPGTMRDLARSASGWAGRKAGFSPEQVGLIQDIATPPGLGGAASPGQIQGAMESMGIDPMTGAQPRTTAERVAGDFLEGATSFPFAPGVSGISNVTGQASRRGAEALGAGPTGQTIAQLAGGAAGGMGSSLAQSMAKSAMTTPAAPTADVLRQAKNAAYRAADNAGVVVKAQRLKRAVADIGQAAKKAGLDKDVTPKAAGAMRRLLAEAKSNQDLSLTDIDTLRKVIRRAAQVNDRGDKAVALAMKSELDNFLDDLKPADLVSGDAAAVQTLKNARSLNTRLSKGEQIDELIENARERASQFSGSGLENALRTEFRQLAKNQKRMKLFTPEEQAAIRAVNRGAPTANFFRFVGKLAPTGVVSGGIGTGGGAALGSAVAGPPGAAIGALTLPAIGGAGRAMATGLTGSAARQARDLMFRGYGLPAQPSSLPRGAAASLIPALPQEPSLLEQEGLMGPRRQTR